ncbi:helix-turn-helix domain-containing protein [Streptomyces prasinus]|uniref:helix-turn-helix domain-containing protein n=1 Tax=Streptomyces prasinus TaxID=67345 RepID=UPI0006EB5262|nr:helix-turn-helix transcriptional regulator [Streptomyces prasinus]
MQRNTQGRLALGDRIADLRTAAHHTQESFSEATGISRRTFQRIERGEADPRYSGLLRIAAVLDTRISVLTD